MTNLVHNRPRSQQPHSQKITLTTNHVHYRPHSCQTMLLQTIFITDHVHNRLDQVCYRTST